MPFACSSSAMPRVVVIPERLMSSTISLRSKSATAPLKACAAQVWPVQWCPYLDAALTLPLKTV